jgi:ribonuclease-3 family protein
MENDQQINKILQKAHDGLEGKKTKAREYSPLVLAYIGDAVFEVFVRTQVIAKGNAPVNKLHRASKEYVKASAQAAMMHKIRECLTQEEEAVFRRGRNAKSATVPKHAVLSDYRHATGFEALIGYLYLDGQMERGAQLISIAMDEHEKEEE